jgi:hypothetical protein
MTVSPACSISEDVFADKFNYGEEKIRKFEKLESLKDRSLSWNSGSTAVVPDKIESERIFPACPAIARVILFNEEIIIHEYDLEGEGGTVTRQCCSSGDNLSNNGKSRCSESFWKS